MLITVVCDYVLLMCDLGVLVGLRVGGMQFALGWLL